MEIQRDIIIAMQRPKKTKGNGVVGTDGGEEGMKKATNENEIPSPEYERRVNWSVGGTGMYGTGEIVWMDDK